MLINVIDHLYLVSVDYADTHQLQLQLYLLFMSLKYINVSGMSGESICH